MNRFREMLSGASRGAFVPFFMLGDPSPEDSLRLIRAALAAGADGLELGIPFSDPIADGPVIQASAIRASAAGATVGRCFEMLAAIRAETDKPIGLLVYYNLVRRRGCSEFCRDCAAAGVDAVLAADLPYGEDGRLSRALLDCGVGSVYLVSQNTPDDRAAEIMKASTAFTYAVGVMGTTGARSSVSDATRAFVERLRALSASPFVVGFGVGNPQQAAEILRLGAHGVIVGSALIERIAAHLDDPNEGIEEVTAFIAEVRALLENETCSS